MSHTKKSVLLILCFSISLCLFAGEDTFTICTYNINWANRNLKETQKLLESINPDFLALQETNAVSRKYLVRKLRKILPYFTFIKDKKHNADGFGFMSKSKISNIKYNAPTFGLFGSYQCNILVKGKKVKIISLHLMPVLPPKGASTSDIIQLFLTTENVRKNEINVIMKNSQIQEPTVILGDLNSTSLQYAPDKLTKMKYIDSFAQTNDNPDSHISWHWNYNGIKLRYRIDYIFHSPQLKTIRSKIIPEGPSDHYPVVSTLLLIDNNILK